MQKQSIPGTVIGFSINGTNVWTEGFGYTDVENDVITHKDSVWRLASISKTLTSALIGRLMDKKLIDLNHDIHKYLSPDFYPYKTFNGSVVNITVREVMSHLAGMGDVSVKYAYRAVNVSETIAQQKDTPLSSKPNTTFSYSNYGYQMVGAIIEAVLNSTYDEEIEKMFRQLNMNSTFAEKREAIYKHRPQFYMNATTLTKSDIIDELVSYEDFLSKETVKELWTPETIGKIKPKDLLDYLGPFEYGFGYTDVENDVITHKDSIWRLASISKTLTSALIGQLMDKKLINLNHNIHRYLSPDFYPYKTFNGLAVNITVREVMSHMAGLRFTKLPDDLAHVFHSQNVSQTISQFKDEKLLSKPNTTFSYSNYGYQMVGAIIEAVLNSTYDKEIEKMFRQLNMNSTFAEKREAIYKHRPQYYMNAKTLTKSDIIDELVSYEGQWPCGGNIATASDMIRFGNAMISAYNGKQKDFLSKETVKELWTPETIGKIKPKEWIELLGPFEYGKGWFIKTIPESDPYPYKKIIWHGGNLGASTTMLILFPDQNIVGVAFANKGAVLKLDKLIENVAKNFKQFL
ncbi:unnamed protein product [Medioppia subpectinata]|uniref:Beta-lactamase-related domain-containing protein n=1 Tax=Medioppia subpectinata TaxID=1979941 RepID=A0A7R9PV12_9ACAR|nr:unnamed protein product [Medioppia subpectinata]CAG2102332.1 unnamed protein product [Medioppia subpectinata]